MAKNKQHEAIVFVLDVGPSMSQTVAGETTSFFDQSLTCLQWILQRKLFSASKDEMALVLCGTPKTSNRLSTELNDQYENITEAKRFTTAQWDFLSFVREKIQLSSVSADFVDSLVVALNMLSSDAEGKEISLRKIVVFSNFGGDYSDDQLDAIVKGLNKFQVELNVIGPDLDDINSNCNAGKNSARQEQAQKLMKTILEKTNGEFYTFSDAIPQLMFYQTKEVRSMPWNVTLDIGRELKIPVSAYIKIKEVKPKPFKSCYARDETTHLTTETSYHKNDEAQTEVQLEELIKAFRYGSTLVPFSEEDQANMKYKDSEKCLSVLGFSKRDNIKVHQYSGFGSRLVVGRKDDEVASTALSAFIHALYETNTVAIVRYCYSARSGPRMGFLAPLIKSKFEALVMILLPYMEDIRRFVFAPLTNKATKKASESQLEAIDDFITKMALVSDDDEQEELLKSSSILNPNVQRAYQCISHRAVDENSLLPETESQFLKHLVPSEKLLNDAKPAIERIKELFPLKVVEKKKKRAATDVFETTENVKNEADESESPTAKKPRLYDSLRDGIAGLVQGPVTTIGTITPVENFKLLINHSGAPPEKVCKEMQNVIVQIVSESFGGQFYSKALDCLKILRVESINAAVNSFNEFLKEIKNTLGAKERKEFWQMIRRENFTLINKHENSTSDVTVDEAKMFLEEAEETKEIAEEELEDDADDLLAMM